MWFSCQENSRTCSLFIYKKQWLGWNATEPRKYCLDQFFNWYPGCLRTGFQISHSCWDLTPYLWAGEKCISLLELGAVERKCHGIFCLFMLNKVQADCQVRIFIPWKISPYLGFCLPTQTWLCPEFYLPKQGSQVKPGHHNHWASRMRGWHPASR